MSGVWKVAVGTSLVFDGERAVVVALDSTIARLRTAVGREFVLLLSLLLTQVISGDDAIAVAGKSGGARGFPLSGIPEESLREAEALLAHLLEARTGERLPASGDQRVDAPLTAYDPSSTTLSTRLAAKALELGMSERAIWRVHRAYEREGLWGLVDKRATRAGARAGGRGSTPGSLPP